MSGWFLVPSRGCGCDRGTPRRDRRRRLRVGRQGRQARDLHPPRRGDRVARARHAGRGDGGVGPEVQTLEVRNQHGQRTGI